MINTLHLPKIKYSIPDASPSSIGMVPVKSLLPIFTAFISFNCPSCVGIDPVNILFSIYSFHQQNTLWQIQHQ